MDVELLASDSTVSGGQRGERPLRPPWVKATGPVALLLPPCCPPRRCPRRGRQGPCAPTLAAAARSTIMAESIGAAAAVAPTSTMSVDASMEPHHHLRRPLQAVRGRARWRYHRPLRRHRRLRRRRRPRQRRAHVRMLASRFALERPSSVSSFFLPTCRVECWLTRCGRAPCLTEAARHRDGQRACACLRARAARAARALRLLARRAQGRCARA